MQPTAPLLRNIRRLALTTKQGPHNYYKGNRTGALGRHTKYGGYKLLWNRVRTYVCPDLSEFPLTPFVPRTIKAIKGSDISFLPTGEKIVTKTGEKLDMRNPRSGKTYLARWKEEGKDFKYQ